MQDTFAKILLLGFLLLYFLAGFSTRPLPGGEAYPFFSWFLFTKVPSPVQTEYSVRFSSIGGKSVGKDLLFPEDPGILSPTHSVTEYRGIVQMLGESFARDDEEAIRHFQNQLEKNFLIHPVSYELVQVTFNPIERWKEGKVMNIVPVLSFTSIPR